MPKRKTTKKATKQIRRRKEGTISKIKTVPLSRQLKVGAKKHGMTIAEYKKYLLKNK